MSKKNILIEGYKSLMCLKKLDGYVFNPTKTEGAIKNYNNQNIFLEKTQASLFRDLKNLNVIVEKLGYNLVDINFNLLDGVQNIKIVVNDNFDNKTFSQDSKHLKNQKGLSVFEKHMVHEITTLHKYKKEFEKENLKITGAHISATPDIKVLVQIEKM